MGFSLFGLNIDIPFVPTIKGVVKGVGHLLHGEFGDAAKAVMKGISQDTTGQIALFFMTAGVGNAVLGTMTATQLALTAGGMGLGVAEGMGALDTKDEQYAKMLQQQASRSGSGQGTNYPQFGCNWGTV
jgi:hypothetical protein